jgi:hypothetical protein
MSNSIVIEISDDEADYAAPVLEQKQSDAARLHVQHLRVRIANASYRVRASFKYRYASERAWQLVVPEEWESQEYEILDWDEWSEIESSVADQVWALVCAFFVPEVDFDLLADMRAAAIDARIADHRSAIEALESNKSK